MCGVCLNYDNGTRHELDGVKVWGVIRRRVVADHHGALRPFLVRPVTEVAHTVILGERLLRIAGLEAELGDTPELDCGGGGEACGNAVAVGATPKESASPLGDGIA